MSSARLIHSIGQLPILGSFFRWWARRYPENSIVTIQHGEAAGLRWLRHHRYVNGYWIGHYELPLQHVLKRELRTGQTFFDVGANAGFFTLVAAKLVGSSGKCVAFEPAPANLECIREQVELNQLAHCQVVAEAVGAQVGESTFSFDLIGSSFGHLGHGREGDYEIAVPVTTLDVASQRFGAPDFVKMDIEGDETVALPAGKWLLHEHKPVWLIELHTPQGALEVTRILREAGYHLFDLQDNPVGSIQG